MTRAALIVAALLVAVPAHAERLFSTGFEFCGWSDAQCSRGSSGNGNPCTTNADCSGGGVCGQERWIFEDSAGGGNIEVDDDTTERTSYCSHDSGISRGKSCSANTDCTVGRTCTDNGDCLGYSNCSGGACVGECWTEAGNDCALVARPSASRVAWVSLGDDVIGAQSTIAAHFALSVDVPSGGGVSPRVRVAAYEAGGLTQCYVDAVKQSATTYSLEVYFEDAGFECGGGTNDGTECATGDGNPGPSSDCTSDSAGEALCGASTYAISPTLTEGRWYEIVLTQTNDGGAVRCGLFESGFDRGAQSRNQGECSDTAYSCATNSDCDNPATCDTSDVAAVDDFILGADSVATTSWVVAYDDVVVDSTDAASIRTLRIRDLTPDSEIQLEASKNGCSGSGNSHECIDDLAAGQTGLDESTTYISRGGNSTTDIHGLSDVGSLAAHESIASDAAVSFVGWAKDHNDGTAGQTKLLGLALHDGTASASYWQTCSVNADCTKNGNGSLMVCNGGACLRDMTLHESTGEYQPDLYGLVTDPPGSDTAFCQGGGCGAGEFDVDDLAIQLRAETDGVRPWRLTASVAEVEIATAGPTLPGIAADVNGDGDVRLCITGDSVANDNAWHSLLASLLVDFDSIVNCTRGTITLADIEAEASDVMDGDAAFLNCRTTRGTAGKCDYVAILAGINTLGKGQAQPALRCYGGAVAGDYCATNGDCGAGTCEFFPGYCRGGADHGEPCHCSKNGVSVTNPETRYCLRNDTGFWRATDKAATCDDCAANADCTTAIPCTANADCIGGTCDGSECFGTCSAGACDASSFDWESVGAVSPQNWLSGGCLDETNCAGGVCQAANPLAEAERALRSIIATAEARTAGDAVEVVVVSEPAPGWFHACTTDDDCPTDDAVSCAAGLCQPATFGNFEDARLAGQSLAASSIVLAEAEGAHWLNLAKYFDLNCTGPFGVERTNCMRDLIHWTTNTDSGGVYHAATALQRCLENVAGAADGRCAASVCTSGLIGDACSANADCDLYRCNLGAP